MAVEIKNIYSSKDTVKTKKATHRLEGNMGTHIITDQ